MIYCKYCYRMLEDGAQTCTVCGKPQQKKASLTKFLSIIPLRNKDKNEPLLEAVPASPENKTEVKEWKPIIINGVPVPKEIWVAMQLHSTFGIFPPDESRFDPMTKQILESCNNDRKSILLTEVELCKPFETPMSYCVIANAYYFLGAAYRRETIEYMTKYLNNPEWMPHVEYFEDDRARYLSGRWNILGHAYEGEYMFEEALKAYNAEKATTPEQPAAYICIATVLSKMNRLDDAIDFLEEAKKTRYYQEPGFGTCFNTTIDSYLSKFEDRKKRGYTYKPRPRKKDK